MIDVGIWAFAKTFSKDAIENAEKNLFFPHFLEASTTLGSIGLKKSQLIFSSFLKMPSSAQLASESLPAWLGKNRLGSAHQFPARLHH